MNPSINSISPTPSPFLAKYYVIIGSTRPPLNLNRILDKYIIFIYHDRKYNVEILSVKLFIQMYCYAYSLTFYIRQNGRDKFLCVAIMLQLCLNKIYLTIYHSSNYSLLYGWLGISAQNLCNFATGKRFDIFSITRYT